MFEHLPDGCIAHVVKQLSSPGDVLNFEKTCKRHAKIARFHQAAWLDLLHCDFNLNSRSVPSALDARALYKSVLESRAQEIRFKGCFTDRGVDENQIQYWVDHLFRPNHWDSFCSELGNNCSCVGVLLEEQDTSDDEQTKLRLYILKRCKLAAATLYGDPHAEQLQPGDPQPDSDRAHYLKLNDWPTIMLNHFFLQLYFELQGNMPLGRTLLYGVPAQSLQSEVMQLQMMASVISHGHNQRLSALKAPENELHILSFEAIKLLKSPNLPNLMGVVERMTISRAGEFSCPVQCGMILISSCNVGALASQSNTACLRSFQAIVSQKTCQEWDGVETLPQLMELVHEGRLPRPIAAHFTPSGGWVEFPPEATPPHSAAVTSTSSQEYPPDQSAGSPTQPAESQAATPELQPLVWFRFCAEEEQQIYSKAYAQQQHEPISFARLQEIGVGLPVWWQAGPDLAGGADEAGFIATGPPTVQAGNPLSEQEKPWLQIQLHQRHAGNLVCVKLINQENLMEAHNDHHSAPNIDANFVSFHGRIVKMGEYWK